MQVTTGNMTITLDQLIPGQRGRIVDVDTSSALGRRLLELGLVPGRRTQMLRSAPFGDPIEIELPGSYLSLRRYEASLVHVALEP
jgi:Fe2+ transport system protein FeoA